MAPPARPASRLQAGQLGLTLMELMVTVAVAVVLLTVAIPNLTEFLRNARRDSQAIDFLTALNYARSEAIKSGTWVTLCPSQNGSICLGSGSWEAGWMLYTDQDGDGSVDDGDRILQVHEALDGVTLRGARPRLRYDSGGFTPAFNDTLRVCDARGAAAARRIILSNQGRARLAAGAASCP